ncbi:MAG: hypothetical protein ACRDID_05270, partial [Ktedonobacterales bacterium]
SIQTAGVGEGERRFAVIRDLRIALRLPRSITTLKSFAKIRRPPKVAATDVVKIAQLSENKQYPFQSTIAYREFVQLGDPLLGLEACEVEVACAVAGADGAAEDGGDLGSGPAPEWLGPTLLAINYLGKRGGFWQPLAAPIGQESLAPDFVEVTRDTRRIPLDGTLQMLDDCGQGLTFEQANIYSPKRIRVGEGRVFRHVVLPYRLAHSSRGYSRYLRVGPETQRLVETEVSGV